MTFKQRTIDVKIGLLEADDRCQTRADQSEEHGYDLVEAYRVNPDSIPPIEVWEVKSGALVVVDGYHRWGAAKIAGLRTVRVTIVGKGDHDDARAYALGANAGHGLKRTNADKRRAVRLALEHPYSADWSHADIAERCHVSTDLVRAVRDETGAPPASKAGRAAAAAKAAEVAKANPTASTREIAKAAGVSRKAATNAKRGVAPGSETTQEPPKPGDGSKRDRWEDIAPKEQGDGLDALREIADAYVAFRRAISAPLARLDPSTRSSIEDPLKGLRYRLRAALPAEAAE